MILTIGWKWKLNFMSPSRFIENSRIMCSLLPSSPRKGKAHVEITCCPNILSNTILSPNEFDLVMLRNRGLHVCFIDGTNAILQFQKNIISYQLFLQLHKFTK